MRKLLFTSLALLFLSSPALGATKYYAQTQAGNGDASSCANADAIADITYSAGDEIHLCGTITSAMTIGASTVTVIFETDAKMSAASWTAQTGLINVSSKSGIVIDGGTNGIIEATDNGTTSAFGGTKGTSHDLTGIYMESCTSCEVKNLTIQTIYDRKASSADCNMISTGIWATGDISGLSVHDNTISDAYVGIKAIATANSATVNIYNNTLSNTGVAIRAAPYSATLDAVNVYGNTVTGGSKWDGEWALADCGCGDCSDGHVHQDGMHLYTVLGDAFTNLKVYNNFLQDFGTHSTAHIYIENAGASSGGTISSAQVFNNVMINTGTNFAANGMLTFKATAGPQIINNTLVGNYPTLGGNRGIYFNSSGSNYCTSITMKNNILSGIKTFVYGAGTFGTQVTFTNSTYNDYYNGAASPFYDGSARNWTYWTSTLGLDATGSITTDPGLDGSYKPGASSNAKWAGTATGQLSSTDKLGVAWHSPPSIGAYEYIPLTNKGFTATGVTFTGVTFQ